jgi:hypothetical protein
MNLSSKITMYDVIAMVIPGFLLLMLFPICCDCQFRIFDGISEVYAGIMIFIACYAIGLIYHKAVECLFNKIGFRNNLKGIEKSAKQFFNNYEENGGNAKNKNDLCYNRHEYYKAYYALMKNNMLNSIPTLEAQVAFIRNVIPIILLYIIALCCCCNNPFGFNPCCLAIVLLLVDIIMVVLLVEIQNKIYFLVWEGNEYLKES